MSIDFEYWLAQTAADHEVKSANAQQRGYRTVSLCLSGRPRDPRITAVMVKDPARVAERFALMSDASWATTPSKTRHGRCGA